MAKSKAQQVFIDSLNPKNIVRYVQGMRNDFGDKFTMFVVSNYFGVKGVVNEYVTAIHLPYYQFGGWSSEQTQTNYQVARTPWSIKSFGGVLTDVLPLFGYEKASYYVIYTVLGCVSIVILGSFNFTVDNVPNFIPVMLFFCIYVQAAFTDLLMEGKYADLMKNNSGNKGNVVSFSYFCLTLGTLIPAASVGTLSDRVPARFIIFLALPFAFQPFIFIIAGCMIEDKASPERNNRFDVAKFNKQVRPMIMCIAMGIVGMGSVLVGLFGTTLIKFIYNIAGAVSLGILLVYTTPRIIAFCLIYVCCVMGFYVDVSGPVEFWYTDKCVVDGPHFSMTYFKTVVGLLGFVGQFIGIWLFQAVLCQYKYRVIFWSTTVIRIIASIFDIIIMTRTNIKLGIPDNVMYLFGSSIIYRAAYQMDFMPSALMCAKVCPRKIETTLFAIAASYGNYGAAVGSYVGIYIADILNVQIDSSKGICEYDNIVIMVLICHFIIPIFTVPLTFVLIPNKYVHEDLADYSFQKSKYYYVDPSISKEHIYT